MRILSVLLALSLSGCCWGDLQTTYIEADRATYDVVAPRFRAYVEKDPALDDDTKKDLDGLVTSWDARLRTGEAAVKQKEEDSDE